MTQTMTWIWDKKFYMGILLILISILLHTSDGTSLADGDDIKSNDHNLHIIMLVDDKKNFICNGVAINKIKGFGPKECVDKATQAISGAKTLADKDNNAVTSTQAIKDKQTIPCPDTNNLMVFKLIGESKVKDGREGQVLGYTAAKTSLEDGRKGHIVGWSGGNLRKMPAKVSASKDCPGGTEKYSFCIKANPGSTFKKEDYGVPFVLDSEQAYFAGMALAGDGSSDDLRVVDLMKYSCWIKSNNPIPITCAEKVPDDRCSGSYLKPGILAFVLLTWIMMTI